MPYFVFDFDLPANRQGARVFRRISARIEAADDGYVTHEDETEIGAESGGAACLFFFGHAVAAGRCVFSRHEAEALLRAGYGLQGDNGSYVALCRDGAAVTFSNDHSGSTPLFWAEGEFGPVVSNSFATLVRHLAGRERPLTLDREVAGRFLVRSTPTDQLFSPRTLVRGIRLIRWGHCLRISTARREWGERLNENIADATAPATYSEAVIEAVNGMVQMMELAARIADVAEIPLTGGQDSRVLYAMARHSGAERFNIYPVANPADNAVAKRLLGLAAGTAVAPEPARLSAHAAPLALEHAVERWERGNLGLYCFYEFSQILPLHDGPRKIELRGGGGGHMRDIFDARTLADLADPEDLGAVAHHPLTRAMSPSQIFYLAYRNRIHFGRTFPEIERLTWRIDPMNIRQVLRAVDLAGPEAARMRQLYLDMILLTHPPAALERFDHEEKAFARETFLRSDFFQSRREIVAPELEIGDVDAFLGAFRVRRGARPWQEGRAFFGALAAHVVETCRDAFPFDGERLDRAVAAFEAGSGSGDGSGSLRVRGREIAKFYSIARLVQAGVAAEG